MEVQTTRSPQQRIDTWHPGGIIVNLILLSVALSFVFGNLALIAAIVYIGRP